VGIRAGRAGITRWIREMEKDGSATQHGKIREDKSAAERKRRGREELRESV